VCVCVCVSAYVAGQKLSNKMTFDLDMWNAGSLDPIWVKFVGQGYGSKFTVTDAMGKINSWKTFL